MPMEHETFENSTVEELIEDLRVVSNGRIVHNKSEFDPSSYRILEKPLDELVISDLISGSWTIFELSEKHGVDRSDIDLIVGTLVKRQDLIESGYVARRVGRDERFGHRTKFRFSLIPIPIEARIFDPTLGLSLLDWQGDITENIDEFFEYPHEEKLTEDYCTVISDFWEIPLEKVSDHFTRQKVRFLDSAFGPLPFIPETEVCERIRNVLNEPPELIQYNFIKSKFSNLVQKYEYLIDQGPGSVPDFQRSVLKLYDALVYYCNAGEDDRVDELLEIRERLFNMVFSRSNSRNNE